MKINAITFRSACPVSSTLDIIGDRWSLLIVRDIVYYSKFSFGEFLRSREGIARNVLSNRLLKLEKAGILFKVDCPDDGRIRSYSLTEKGLDLIPLLFELTEWGATHVESTIASQEWLQIVAKDKMRAISVTRQAVTNGDSVFTGKGSAINLLRNDHG